MNGGADASLRTAFSALARGDMTGLDAVWRELAGPLHNYAFALTSSHEDADDILGDCLERLARRGWRLRLVRDPKGYLFTSVRNAARSRGRRARGGGDPVGSPRADARHCRRRCRPRRGDDAVGCSA